MKTLKNTTIIAGIIVALISLSAHAADKKGGDSSISKKQVILENMGINKNLEYRLISEYLEEQEIIVVEKEGKKIIVYGSNDELVYEGSDEKAAFMKLSADFLMEYENVSYYKLYK